MPSDRVTLDPAVGRAGGRWAEIQPRLDEAVARLPIELRDAVIVRCLQGTSEDAAGRELGCSASEAASRAARGLARLQDFFRKRGYAVPRAALASILAASRAGAAPPGLADRIVAVCAGAALASPSVLEIVERVEKRLRRAPIAIEMPETAAATPEAVILAGADGPAPIGKAAERHETTCRKVRFNAIHSQKPDLA